MRHRCVPYLANDYKISNKFVVLKYVSYVLWYNNITDVCNVSHFKLFQIDVLLYALERQTFLLYVTTTAPQRSRSNDASTCHSNFIHQTLILLNSKLVYIRQHFWKVPCYIVRNTIQLCSEAFLQHKLWYHRL